MARFRPAIAAVLTACFSEPPPPGGGASDATTSTSTSAGVTGASTLASTTTTTMTDSDDPVEPTLATSIADTTTTVEPSTGGVSPGYCSMAAAELPQVLACRDFDDVGGEVGSWMSFEVMGGTSQVLADAEAPSQPNALRTEFPAMIGITPYGSVRTGLDDLPAPMTMRFRMEMQACDGPTPLVHAEFDGDDPLGIQIVMNGNTLVLRVDPPAGAEPMDYDLDPMVLANAGAWAEWEVAIDVVTGYVGVSIDDMVAIGDTMFTLPTSMPDPPRLHFGVLGGDYAYGCGVWFDDIVVF